MAMRYRAIVDILFRATDALVVCGVWFAACWLRLASPPYHQQTLPDFHAYAALAPVILLLWSAVFSLLGIYHAGRMRGRLAEVLRIWRAHATALLVFVFLAYLIDDYKYSRLVLIYFGVLGAVALAVFRVALRTVLRALRRRGYDVRPIVVVGGAAAVEPLVARFESYPELGVAVIGLVTGDSRPPAWCKAIPILGSFAEMAEVVERYRPSEVLIALAAHEAPALPSLLGMLRDAVVNVRVIPDVYDHVTLSCRAENFEGMAIMRVNDSPMDVGQQFAKRCIDAALSAVGLLVLSPVLLAIAALVKATSAGPVLYSQERMGLDGRTFKMFKFRSMRVDSEASSGAGWTRRNDDRRTPIGAALRKTSLDELPQLWNVLLGHMSLVGPRPERPVFVQQFREQIPHYMLRHKVKSGITGWAQVNGWRGDTSLTERTACDLYYIRNWSLDLDLKILWLTLWKGFVNKNAY
jgi:Undecaprenyl-phosphate glucose phosphotransferase